MERLAASTADFERFVYADVADEPNGMKLTVISALSRAGLDPWAEAQRLAQLPPVSANASLAQTLLAVPAVRSARTDVNMIARRLVELLPKSVSPLREAVQPKLPVTPRSGVLSAIAFGFFVAIAVSSFVTPRQTAEIAPSSWLTEKPGEASKPADQKAASPAPAKVSPAPDAVAPVPSAPSTP
jgi:hypothetical protein